MSRTRWRRLAASYGLVAMLLCTRLPVAHAAAISVIVMDDNGQPLSDAVVMVSPHAGVPVPPLQSSKTAAATIEQKDETFVPFVVVIRTYGTLTFLNRDKVRHHVYSFATIKRFEMVQNPAETSPPIQFDKPGSAAIGCNVYDNMATYVYVT
jgi:plastocyanin